MAEIYFTITGTNHYHGKMFLEQKMQVQLEKEPDNQVDSEAIKSMRQRRARFCM